MEPRRDTDKTGQADPAGKFVLGWQRSFSACDVDHAQNWFGKWSVLRSNKRMGFATDYLLSLRDTDDSAFTSFSNGKIDRAESSVLPTAR
ncbi:MAG: hypothetical protein JW888_08340 [Pirellulales bacterium]|nr:hypothetical protein [Pirellulales bacterium]